MLCIASRRCSGRSPDWTEDALSVLADPMRCRDHDRQGLGTPNEPGSIRLLDDPIFSRRVGSHEQERGEPLVVGRGVATVPVPIVGAEFRRVLPELTQFRGRTPGGSRRRRRFGRTSRNHRVCSGAARMRLRHANRPAGRCRPVVGLCRPPSRMPRTLRWRQACGPAFAVIFDRASVSSRSVAQEGDQYPLAGQARKRSPRVPPLATTTLSQRNLPGSYLRRTLSVGPTVGDTGRCHERFYAA